MGSNPIPSATTPIPPTFSSARPRLNTSDQRVLKQLHGVMWMRDFDDYLMESYETREKLVADKFRPRYHFAPPEGRWNDINGATFWKGRYHLGYLQKIANGPGERDFSSWQHISSRDLLHWRYHKASLREPLEGKRGDYFNSGDVMEAWTFPQSSPICPDGASASTSATTTLWTIGYPCPRIPSYPWTRPRRVRNPCPPPVCRSA